jgi:hypothetical protein
MDRVQTKSLGCAEIVETNLPALQALCRRFGVRRLDLFGSAATGRFDPARSDLDFLVDFEKPPSGGFSSDYFKLLHELEILFQRKVDLLKESALVNPYLRRQIESEKRRLYPPND